MEIKNKILIIGFGKLGQKFASLSASAFDVHAIKRNPLKNPPIGVQVHYQNIFSDEFFSLVKNIDPHYVIYSVAADDANEDSYQKAYVDGVDRALQALTHCRNVKHFIFISSTRVYGQEVEKILTEEDIAQPADANAQRLLRGEALVGEGVIPSSIIRLSGIYGGDRNYLIRLAKDPDLWPKENRWTNRIHEDDVAKFSQELIQKIDQNQGVDNLILLTDNHSTPLFEVLNWIRAELGLKAIDLPVGPIKGKRLNSLSVQKNLYQLIFPSYREGYGKMLSDLNQ